MISICVQFRESSNNQSIVEDDNSGSFLKSPKTEQKSSNSTTTSIVDDDGPRNTSINSDVNKEQVLVEESPIKPEEGTPSSTEAAAAKSDVSYNAYDLFRASIHDRG